MMRLGYKAQRVGRHGDSRFIKITFLKCQYNPSSTRLKRLSKNICGNFTNALLPGLKKYLICILFQQKWPTCSYSGCVSSSVIHASSCLSPGFIGKITLQIPFYRPHSDPWVISMSQLNLIIGPAQLQEYDGEKEREEERERKTRLLKALEDKFKVGGSTLRILKCAFCLSHLWLGLKITTSSLILYPSSS